MARSRVRRPRSPNRAGLYALIALVGVVAVVSLLRGVALVYTDYLWFRSLFLAGVWKEIVAIKILLTLVFFLVFFAVLYINMAVADRLAPAFRAPSVEDEFIERYHAFVGPRLRTVRLVVAAFFGLIAASGAASQWNEWLLFRHAQSFGVTDPQFGRDAGFYVFRLPFLSFAIDWAFAALVTIVFITAAVHFLNGGIRTRVPPQASRLTDGVKVHLSVLLAAVALVKLADYWLDRFALTTSDRGFVNGASYTDVKAQLPAIHLLMVITAFSFVLLVVNVRRKGSGSLAVTVGLWALVSVVAGQIYPAFIQRFRVEPAESQRESPYIARNIAATRFAYAIEPGSHVDSTPFDYAGPISARDIRNEADQLRRARIVDPESVHRTFQELQVLRGFYEFAGERLDVDEYLINNEPTQVVIGARVLNPDAHESFERRHVAYTHGFGVVVASASQVNAQGAPEFLISGIPPERSPAAAGFPDLVQPQIYFGEGMHDYAIVKASRKEIDYVDKDNREILTTYVGQGGVSMGSLARRLMFSLRFGQIDPLISSYVTSESKVIYVRDVRERVEKVAPFIRWDSDPYPVVSNGRVVYLLDGYTTSDRYPYAQRADLGQIKLPDSSGLNVRFNYVRNSVKAVVDAYDGTVSLYVFDSDPIVNAYRKAFPSLFVDAAEMPADLASHVRYPLDLFSVQTHIYGRYHISDPSAFHDKLQWWAVAQEPGRIVAQRNDDSGDSAAAAGTAVETQRRDPVRPYYYQVRMPGDTGLSYVAQRSFVPFTEPGRPAPAATAAANGSTKQNLTAMMFASSEPGVGSRLRVFEMPGDNLPAGPAIVSGRVTAQTDISKEISLLNTQGSEVSFGDLLVYPVGQSLLYVLPLYVTGQQSTQAVTTQVPTLAKVIVAYGANADNLAIGNTLPSALASLFGQSFADVFGATTDRPSPPTAGPPTPGAPPSGPNDARAQTILREIESRYAEADQALRQSDLKRYADAQDAIRRLVAELSALFPAGTPAPSTNR